MDNTLTEFKAEPSLWEALPEQDLTFDDYMLVDTDIAVWGALSDAEIVALDYNNTESDEDESEELTPATLSEAKVSLNKLRNFFLQNHVDADILQASFVLEKSIDKHENSACVEVGTIVENSACVEVGTIVENSACVEAGTTISQTPAKRCQFEQFQLYYLRRGEITVESKLFSIIGYIVRASNKGARKKKATRGLLATDHVILNHGQVTWTTPELAPPSPNYHTTPTGGRFSSRQIYRASLQSLERAFLTKKINDEYKSEILINLLGERAHNVLLYIKEEELNDYEKLKSIVLREFQLTPRECLNSFKNAVKSSGVTYIQFAARLTANFQYYCSLRKVNSFESLCDLIISDKLFETLNKENATHIGIREAEDWFRPIDLAKECDIYISSRSGSHKEILLLMDIPKTPLKIDHKTLNQRLKRTIPNILKKKIKIALYAVIHLIAQETVRSVLNLKNLTTTSIIE
ncbi:uncharacterized protein TNCV_1884841 [Trichonephila clavipes]|nr:uncharacterized protein TNCV_1884841 [Trichonephila clavipes]